MTPKQEQIAARRVIVEALMAELGLGFDEVRFLLTGRRTIQALPGRSEIQVRQVVTRARQDVVDLASRIKPIPPREPRTRS